MKQPPHVISFGEVLFDLFDDGPRIGGAPLNLAVHLHRLGCETTLISALGRDELGAEARRRIVHEGLSDRRVASADRPTGTVRVKLDAQKVPTYTFAENCSYDVIPLPAEVPSDAALFCFGSLAQRGEVSRRTLQQLLKKVKCPVFFDVNLRQNFYNREILASSLAAADILKLNEEELPVLASLFRCPAASAALAERFSLRIVILTLGAAGCEIQAGGRVFRRPAAPCQVVSTVGAGDAFSAAFLAHYLAGDALETCAEAGSLLAAQVAAQTGAF